ncbi:MAG: hypothetical protein Q8R10_05685 [Pseudomonas sp.]|uniref:hypothetical protein n=1 Tax=Pseudomonas sp. TaxID=306 RepID=UPI002736DAFE|nr:hypothetical protein [Pseudomonas sp.]MDP3845900.1 hypothetical protein [Pseudomonas sp.]
MKHQDWERDGQQNPLRANRDDALSVNDWLRQRQRPKRSAFWRFANVLGVLGILALAAYLLAEHNGLNQLLHRQTQGLLNPAPPAIALKPIDLQQPIAPQQPRQPANARPDQLPQNTEPTPRRGMVSAEYLAQYRADQANSNSAPARQNVERDSTLQRIPKWDGNGQYLAQWQSINNRIDSSSVCSNHKRGSIDYRGCRKAAKVYFREQCRAWKLSWERGREEHSKQMEQRYCSAANGFSPMG